MKLTVTLDARSLLFGAALAALPFAAFTVVPHAQTKAAKVGIVNVQRVLAATPGGANVAALRKKADTDLGAQAKKIQALQAKISTNAATAADRQALDVALKTYQTAQQNYGKQVSTAFQPVAGVVNSAVAKTAAAQGFTIVMDYAVAQQSGLVIYADSKATDLTDAVIKSVKK